MILFEKLSTNYQPVTVFLVVVLISFIIKYYFDKRRIFTLGSKIPGPKGWPILGNALEFLDCDYGKYFWILRKKNFIIYSDCY